MDQESSTTSLLRRRSDLEIKSSESLVPGSVEAHRIWFNAILNQIDAGNISADEAFSAVYNRVNTIARVVSEKKSKVEYDNARTDALTGLPNRRAFDEKMAQLRGKLDRVGMVEVDIDHFKSFNDTHGHKVGDDVLRKVADRLMASMRLGDTVFRKGGEEFFIVTENGETQEELFVLAERARETVQEVPFEFSDNGQTLTKTLTITLGAASGREAKSVEHLEEIADNRLYIGKQLGRDRTVASDVPLDKQTVQLST